MRIPKRPQDFHELLGEIKGDEFPQLLQKVREPTVNGRYVHWDKLRHLPLPEGLDHRRWWVGLKLRRQAQGRELPLLDKGGTPFTFNLADPLPERLHHADSQARGSITQSEPVVNSSNRDAYIARSLIEESITSSQLEGASTTRDVAREMIRQEREPDDRSERMILNNYRAMQRIRELRDQKMSRDLLFELHRIVTNGTLDREDGAGRFRTADENIVVGDDQEAVFHVPPPAADLQDRVIEMCKFANSHEGGPFIHPMIRSMILHFWLAYDHPFVDGNGRTARALFYWSMLRHGYWLFEYMTISKVILKSPGKYGRSFLYVETDENDLTYFLLYHAEVIRQAIDELHDFLSRRTKRLQEAQRDIRGLDELNHRQRELIAHALRHPGRVYMVESHRSSHEVVYETARSDLMNLVERGLLLKKKSGKTWQFRAAPQLENRLRGPAD